MTRPFPKFGYDPITGEWNDSLKGDYCWSNVNSGEAVPDVMTPSTWSLLWTYLYDTSAIHYPDGHPAGGNIAGRPYFNLSVIRSLYHAIGVNERKLDELFGTTLAELDISYIPFSPLSVLRHVLPGMIKDSILAKRDIKEIPWYITFIPEWYRAMLPRIQQCKDASGLLTLWDESIQPTVLRCLRMQRNAFMNLPNVATKLKLDLIALVGEAEANTLLSNLSGASGDLESLAMMLGLAKVKDGRISREQYIERYGHRGPHEVELSAPVAGDDPEWLDKRLADFNQSAVDVDALLAKQHAEFSSAWQRFEKRFPDKYQTFRNRLELFASDEKKREAIRSESTRKDRLIRQFLLKVGEVTGIDNDIFFLTLDEMTALLSGDRQTVSYISARREMYQRYCALPPYPSIIYGHFNPFEWAADPNRRSDFYDARQKNVSVPDSIIKGYAGAAGCVEGIVRRIDRIEEGNQIQIGEILVTSVTNIGWTLLFPRVSAIVTDVGAPLSHAAIVARELGIPAVVGCRNATMMLKTGDYVRVDGGQGIVEVLNKVAARPLKQN